MMIFYNALTILPLLVSSVYASSLQMKGPSTSNHAVESGYVQEEQHHSSFERSLFEMPSTFDFYNSLCRARCDGTEELLPFINPCPQCPDHYESAHCNNCCQGGASSIKILWHGCGGTLSFASTSDTDSDCGSDESTTTDTARFVDCDCYDSIVDPSDFDAFECPIYESLFIPVDVHSFEICIVAVSGLDFGLGAATLAVDFSKPLPGVLGLTHTFDSIDDDSQPRMASFQTYFDTTCSIKSDDSQFSLPIFPGYGKFPNTCKDFGFIDLEDGSPLIPEVIPHLNGNPPAESFWYEFVDGTSAAFWPSTEVKEHFFHPTFAQCSCSQCGGVSDTIAPNSASSYPTPASSIGTEKPTDGSIVDPTVAPSALEEQSNRPSSVTSSLSPSSQPTQDPTAFRNPGPAIFTQHPSKYPSLQPTATPSSNPTTVKPAPDSFTSKPSAAPTQAPSASPSSRRNPGPAGSAPTGSTPTLAPSSTPATVSPVPSAFPPSSRPSNIPTTLPSVAIETPSADPTVEVSDIPTSAPSDDLTTGPSDVHSIIPSSASSGFPSVAVSAVPTSALSENPTTGPSDAHSVIPSSISSGFPSVTVSVVPTAVPTLALSENPTTGPSDAHSVIPSSISSGFPSVAVSAVPTSAPSDALTSSPSGMHSGLPSFTSSENPTHAESASPSTSPSDTPTVPALTGRTTTNPSAPPTSSSAFPTTAASANPTDSKSEIPSFGPSPRPPSQESTPSIEVSAEPSISPTHAEGSSQCLEKDFLECSTFASTSCRIFAPAAVGGSVRECRYEGQAGRRSLLGKDSEREVLLAKLEHHRERLAFILAN